MKDEWEDAIEVSAQATETWDQEKPLVGQYIGSKSDVGPNKSMMYNIKNDDGEIIGMWGATVLDTKMAEVPVGSRVKITYNGKIQGKNSQYKDYTVLAKIPEALKNTAKEDLANGKQVDLADIPFPDEA